jgi:probable F420-dependent oxidoreductase
VKVDTPITGMALREVPATARRAEALGYDAVNAGETTHDAFMLLTLAAEHTERVAITSGIVVAFARSPMVTAYESWSVQGFSGGRFVLGLGSQVKGHIERRFGMPWTAPGPRLREYILALREIWRAFQEERAPNFRGDHYSFSLMNPEFRPKPIAHPDIPVYISAINPYMCRLAGEVCQGLRLHAFNTREYLTSAILPNVEAGLAKSGRRREDFVLVGTPWLATGRTDAEVERARARIRRSIAFFGATRTYHAVFAAHEGWAELGQRLHQLSLSAKWDEMAGLIPEEMVDAFTIAGRYDQLAARMRERYGGILDVMRFELPRDPELDGIAADLIRALHAPAGVGSRHDTPTGAAPGTSWTT